MDIGAKIKNARAAAGLTQEQAAEALGVSRQTVSNWENGKSYPDIVSVIRMSGVYAVSLDHLLKEEEPVKQTYLGFLEESTGVVKSRERLARIVLIAATLFIWAAAELALWLVKGAGTMPCGVVFRWILLPATAVCVSLLAGKNDYWGAGKWLLIPAFALLFLLTPYASFGETEGATVYAYRFLWPNFWYMPIGALLSFAALWTGKLLRDRKKEV